MEIQFCEQDSTPQPRREWLLFTSQRRKDRPRELLGLAQGCTAGTRPSGGMQGISCFLEWSVAPFKCLLFRKAHSVFLGLGRFPPPPQNLLLLLITVVLFTGLHCHQLMRVLTWFLSVPFSGVWVPSVSKQGFLHLAPRCFISA